MGQISPINLLLVLRLAIILLFSCGLPASAFSFTGGNYTGTPAQRAEALAYIQEKITETRSRIASPDVAPPLNLEHSVLKHRDMSATTIDNARLLVSTVSEQFTQYNKYRLEHPKKNTYQFRNTPGVSQVITPSSFCSYARISTISSTSQYQPMKYIEQSFLA